MSYAAAVARTLRFGSESHGRAVNYETSDEFLRKYSDAWKSLMHPGRVGAFYAPKMEGSKEVGFIRKVLISPVFFAWV